MTTQIQPTLVITKGNAEFISLHTTNYVIGADNASIGWDLMLAVRGTVTAEDGTTTNTIASGECILSGELLIDGADFIAWGSDDNYLINWVLTKLSLTKI